MSQEIVDFDVNNAISLESSTKLIEDFKDEYYPDNKVCISKTTITNTVINISSNELNGYTRNDKIRKYETLAIDHINTDLPLSEVYDAVENGVKIEDGICPSDIQIAFCNKLLFCNHCQEVYQDYCTKCRVLVHILNERLSHNTYNRELPEYMLETRESIGHLGIFSIKVIPENIRFGPFTGLNSTGLSLKIKGGRFVVSNDKLKHLNWMQYINPARNIYEQNLFPFQYEDRLYYCSTRRIQVGEELLVYFGEEYEDNLLKNVETDFVPITKENVENVFACTFCCLGFRLKEYLADHKTVCHGQANKIFSVKELAQCPLCKIYLEEKEYFEHHVDYCCETNDRYCVLPSSEVQELEVERRSSEKRKTKRWKRGLYKCMQCKFRTMYNADFRRHANEHYKVKMYKCGFCLRRYKTRRSLKAHVEKIHADNLGRDVQKYPTYSCFKSEIKNIKEKSTRSHDGEKQFPSLKSKIQIMGKRHLKSLVNTKHLNRGKYKCANCEFKTYYGTYLEMHMKMKHLMESDYKCAECEYKTNYKSSLRRHMKVKHLKQNDYKCTECEFRTYYKYNLESHIKVKHLKFRDYKCTECEYKTNYKANLENHKNAIHLQENNYKCMECGYKTYYKSNLEAHVKVKHLKERDYKCTECEYKTHYKSDLHKHINAKHLKDSDYKCMECEFKTYYKSLLKVHVKTKHLKDRDYKCMDCEYKTYYKYNLDAHVKVKHLKKRDYKCIECEYKTNYKSGLQRHVKAKHLKENDYKCVECEFKTYYKSNLEMHIKVKHLKVRDYKCLQCEYKANYKSNLQKHIKAMHLKQKDYKCMECEYEANRKLLLERHIKAIHLKINDYKCAECEYKTNSKSHLGRHIKRIHLKISEYKCTVCKYRADDKSYLEKHIKTIHLK